MEKGYIRADALDVTQDSLSVDMTTGASNTTKQTFSIKTVVDTNTGEYLHPTVAVERGILDLPHEQYYNLRTGQSITIHEAYTLGLIRADEGADSAISPIVSTTSSQDTYNIQVVIDPRSGVHMTVVEAVRNGLLNSAVTRFTDIRTDESMSIREAVERGYIILMGENSSPGAATLMRVIGFALDLFSQLFLLVLFTVGFVKIILFSKRFL